MKAYRWTALMLMIIVIIMGVIHLALIRSGGQALSFFLMEDVFLVAILLFLLSMAGRLRARAGTFTAFRIIAGLAFLLNAYNGFAHPRGHGSGTDWVAVCTVASISGVFALIVSPKWDAVK